MSIPPQPPPSSTSAFSVEAFRRQFAFFQERDIRWLDNAATTQRPEPVLAAMDEFARLHNANVRRGLNRLGAEATAAYEDARATVAAFLGAASPAEIIFTSGTTAGIHLAVEGLVRPLLHPGDQLWVTMAEHHSNFLPWARTAQTTGAELHILPLAADGRADVDFFLAHARPGHTPWLAATWVSNVTGAQNPVPALADAVHRLGGRLFLDASQGVPHHPVNVQAMGCDLLAFSGHKMYGPTGMGALWGRLECLRQMQPVILGGEMVDRVTEDSPPVWTDIPWRFEAGTPNVIGAVGLAAAIRFLTALPPAAHDHVRALSAAARRDLLQIPGLRLWSLPDAHALTTFTLPPIHPHDVAQILDSRQIAIRAGNLCAEPLLTRLGAGPVLRASFAPYNQPGDVAALIDALQTARTLLAP